jgi:geranylgeranyl pyrophosphate synthase
VRRFKSDGDLATAVSLLSQSQGIARAKELAAHHAAMAADLIRALPEAQSVHAAICRAALIKITQKVLTRSK